MGPTPAPAQGLRRLADRIEQAGIAVTVQVDVYPEDKQQAASLAAALAPAMVATTEPVRQTARTFEYWKLTARVSDCLERVVVYGPSVGESEVVAS